MLLKNKVGRVLLWPLSGLWRPWLVGAGCCLSYITLVQGPSGHPRPPTPGPSGRHPYRLLRYGTRGTTPDPSGRHPHRLLGYRTPGTTPGPSGRRPHHLLGEATGLNAGLQGERRGCGWGVGGAGGGPQGS